MLLLLHPAVAVTFWLLVGPVLGQYDAFGLIDDLAPQYWHGTAADLPLLAKRDGNCESGSHPCSDVNSTVCCPNTKYCIVNSTWGVQCCDFGSTCDNICSSDYYYANYTKTVTVTVTTSSTTTSSTTINTQAVCSPRSCTSSNYLCASSFGGGCCGYGSDCASSNQCIGPSSTSSAAMSTIVTPIPSGCSLVGQTYCSAPGGSGCCDAGYACLISSSTPICSSTTATSTGTNTGATLPTGSSVIVKHKASGLSTGAKAGIAVGVVIAAAVLIGGLTWMCLRRRRSSRSTTTGNEMRNVPPGGGGAVSEVGGGSDYRPYGGTGTAASAPTNASEIGGYAPSSTQMSHGGPLRGLTTDYFGPEAGIGPYTDRSGGDFYYGGGTTAATTPENHHLAQSGRAEGQAPHGPDDVVAPVEIGLGGSVRRPQGRTRVYSQAGSETAQSELADTSRDVPAAAVSGPGVNMYQSGVGGARESIAGRFELYSMPPEDRVHETAAGPSQPFPTPGSEISEIGTTSPISREEQQPRREV